MSNRFFRLYSRLAGNSKASRRPTVPLYANRRQSPEPQPMPAIQHLNPMEGLLPVKMGKSSPRDILNTNSGPYGILANPALMIGRQLEMMNVLLGYEQANKYSIKNHYGQDVGFIAETDSSFVGAILRQLLRTRRAFDADILDSAGNVVLRVNRPIRWFLNSEITISTPDGTVIGVVTSDWHLWRRRYDLFVSKKQFARIDGGFLTWDFISTNESGSSLAAINRNFLGFATEIFTDKGKYAVHFDSELVGSLPLSLDQRAVILAAAVTIDIDYFSRSGGNGLLPIPIPFIGGGDSDLTDVTRAGTTEQILDQPANWGSHGFEEDEGDSDGDGWF